MQIYQFDTTGMRVQMWSQKLGDLKSGFLKISFTTKDALARVKPILDNANKCQMRFYIRDKQNHFINYVTGLYWDTSKPIDPDQYQNVYFVSASGYPSTYTLTDWSTTEFYAVWE